MSTRSVRYTGIEDEPKHGGHVLGAERLDGGLIRIWCSCGWRGDEYPVSDMLDLEDRFRIGKPWANHVALSTSIARSVL